MTTKKSMRGRVCDRIGICDGCGFRLYVSIMRDEWLCRSCLIGDEIPLRIEDYAGYVGPLADHGRMDGAAIKIVRGTPPFLHDLIAAMERHGIPSYSYQDVIGAGADDGKAEKQRRLEKETY